MLWYFKLLFLRSSSIFHLFYNSVLVIPIIDKLSFNPLTPNTFVTVSSTHPSSRMTHTPSYPLPISPFFHSELVQTAHCYFGSRQEGWINKANFKSSSLLLSKLLTMIWIGCFLLWEITYYDVSMMLWCIKYLGDMKSSLGGVWRGVSIYISL